MMESMFLVTGELYGSIVPSKNWIFMAKRKNPTIDKCPNTSLSAIGKA